ncbi:MAG: hypothetical protein ACTSSH_13480 [Candidatus Heimdallarchaeota archaeon]
MPTNLGKDKAILNKELLLIQEIIIGDQQYLNEINDLVNNHEFIEFAKTISNLIDDEATFDELLSSQVVLKQALAVLERLREESFEDI